MRSRLSTDGKVRLVSRNQNDLTPRYPELKDLAKFIKAKTAILDGEVVALDKEGKASFSLMQQRTGFRPGGKRAVANADVPVLYYAFDLLYLDGYDWRRVPLEERKRKLASLVVTGDAVRYSDHYEEHGKALFDMAQKTGWRELSPRSAPASMKNGAAASGSRSRSAIASSASSAATPSPKAAARILARSCSDSTTARDD